MEKGDVYVFRLILNLMFFVCLFACSFVIFCLLFVFCLFGLSYFFPFFFALGFLFLFFFFLLWMSEDGEKRGRYEWRKAKKKKKSWKIFSFFVNSLLFSFSNISTFLLFPFSVPLLLLFFHPFFSSCPIPLLFLTHPWKRTFKILDSKATIFLNNTHHCNSQ